MLRPFARGFRGRGKGGAGGGLFKHEVNLVPRFLRGHWERGWREAALVLTVLWRAVGLSPVLDLKVPIMQRGGTFCVAYSWAIISA